MLDKNEQMIVECIESQPVHFDEILAATGFEIGLLSTVLLKLEFEGIIKSLPGNSYVKIFYSYRSIY
jgi:DNA processing protein